MRFVTDQNRKWWTLGALSISLFMVMLDNTVVTVALPAMAEGLDASIPELEWVINAYALTFAVLLMSAGRLADVLGRRSVFLFGLVIFALASVACGLAPSGEFLIGARAVQGFGAAFMLPATISILAATFPVAERGMALGVWAGVSGVALAVGPVVGGVLVDGKGWEWIFYINVPVAIVGLIATLVLVRESRDVTADRRLDVPGILLSAALVLGFNFALIETHTRSWTSSVILLSFAVGATALVAFVLVEARSSHPMIRLSLLRERTFASVTVAGLLFFLTLFGFIVFISIYLQDVVGWTASQAGASFLALTVATSIAAPIGGKMNDSIGPRLPIAGGAALVGVALVLLAVAPGVETETTLLALLPWFALLGFGFGLAQAPMTAAALDVVGLERAGIASGIVQTFRQFGVALGVGVMGAVMAHSTGALAKGTAAYDAAFVDGLTNVFLLGAGFAFLAAVISAVGLAGGVRVDDETLLGSAAGSPPA